MFFSFPPFNCYLFAGKWKEFSWDQPGFCQQLEVLWGRCKSKSRGLFSTRRGSLRHGQPGWVGLILPFFYRDVDKCRWELQGEERGPGPEGFFSLLMGNRRWLGRNLAKRETFLSLPAWKKASSLPPASPQKAAGSQRQPLQRRQKVPAGFTRDGAVWGHQPWFARGVQPASATDWELSHPPLRHQGVGMPQVLSPWSNTRAFGGPSAVSQG